MSAADVAPPAVGRAALTMGALTVVSRITGFVRVLVVAAVLGTTFLGNTYQLANTVPNVLFELFAAGALQAVLVPSFVAMFDSSSQDERLRFVGAVFGVVSLGLGAVAAIGMITAPWIMALLVRGVDDPVVRHDQARLGSLFLVIFLPQLVFYGAGLVASAALNARDHFAVPAFAPIVNNVVVIAAYLGFAALRDGAEPSLSLTAGQKAVLGGGTTLAVVAFCSIPVVAAVRRRVLWRPNLDVRQPRLRRLFVAGSWAAVYLAATQVLLVMVYVLANAVAGGVIAYQIAFTFFLLPYGIFAVPIATAGYPTLSRLEHRGDRPAFAALAARSLDLGVFWLAPAAAALCALCFPIARLVLFGHADRSSVALVAPAIAAFAPGVVAYGVYLMLTRAFYAFGDAREPAMVNLIVVASGAVAMALASLAAPTSARLVVLGVVHTSVYVVGAIVLSVGLRRRGRGAMTSASIRSVLLAFAAALVMVPCAAVMAGNGRTGALTAAVLGGTLGAIVYFGGQRLWNGPLRAQTSLVEGLRG
ncbi:MAG: murein biosynthesis integral membrane protein MurJ [Acidimicrobiia bacterium]